MLNARKLADYLLALFYQSKIFYTEKQNKVRQDQQIKMFNTTVALSHATSFVK